MSLAHLPRKQTAEPAHNTVRDNINRRRSADNSMTYDIVSETTTRTSVHKIGFHRKYNPNERENKLSGIVNDTIKM